METQCGRLRGPDELTLAQAMRSSEAANRAVTGQASAWAVFIRCYWDWAVFRLEWNIIRDKSHLRERDIRVRGFLDDLMAEYDFLSAAELQRRSCNLRPVNQSRGVRSLPHDH